MILCYGIYHRTKPERGRPERSRRAETSLVTPGELVMSRGGAESQHFHCFGEVLILRTNLHDLEMKITLSAKSRRKGFRSIVVS
jgi:hypothetical protein